MTTKTMVVYIFWVQGKPYIGQTMDLEARWSQHCRHVGGNPMYKVWDNPEKPKVLYQYTGKSTNLSYIKRVLRKQETHYIKYYNSFLDGWNQQIYNERPSQTLKKYILDYKLTKNKKLLTQIEWKLDNCNIYGKEHTKLRALLWGPRVFW